MQDSIERRSAHLDIESECVHALTAAAAAEGAGTRQQRRAASRRFVRRHRRDTSYLLWVLRSVVASTALAVTLLGLGAESASAGTTLFVEQTGGANPVNGADAGGNSNPTFADLDADGDLDLIVSGYPLPVYYENTGSPAAPIFTERTGGQNPFANLAETYIDFYRTAFGDLDGDGDLDMLAARQTGNMLYYVNNGDAANPFLESGANPFAGEFAGSTPKYSFGDLDADGDLDLVSGQNDGTFLYYENVGTATTPDFDQVSGPTNPFDGLDAGALANVALGDLDGDGDLDLLAGENDGMFFYYENTGSAASPVFVPRTGTSNPLDGVDVPTEPFGRTAPALGDLDGDGDLDLLTGEREGTLLYYENLAGSFVAQTGAANPLDGENVGSLLSSPAPGDLDGDGDLDVVAGARSGGFFYYENTGSEQSPAFVERTDAANPLLGMGTGTDLAPKLGDLDGDGDLDMVSGEAGGIFTYFENTGSRMNAVFVERTGSSNPLDLEDVGTASRPTLGDVDGDGDIDVIAGSGSGTLLYYENTGTRMSAVFTPRTGTANPLDGVDVGEFAKPELGDVDGDGDLDLWIGERFGGRLYYENVGTPGSADFFHRTGEDDPMAGQPSAGQNPVPSLADLDDDGDLDLLAGSQYGDFFYNENAVVTPLPQLFQLAAADNPLNGHGGTGSDPALSDVDGDGDLDMFYGRADGTFVYLENTGGATTPAFTERTGTDNPLGGERMGGQFSNFNYSTLTLGDVDGDGDPDIIAGGEQLDRFTYYENTGDATSPAFVELTTTSPLTECGTANPTCPEAVSYTLGDVDGDGDLDLVSGAQNGTILYFENTGSAVAPTFTARGGGSNPFNGIQLEGNPQDFARTRADLGDVDADGDLDLVAGNTYGDFHYFENIGNPRTPVFVERFGAENPLDAQFGRGDPTEAPRSNAPNYVLGDLDGDGDLDVVAGGGALRTLYNPLPVPEPAQGLMLSVSLGLIAWIRRRSRRRLAG